MVNKVLAAYVAIDFLFVISGAIMVGFCVIVKNIMYEPPTDGSQAVRNLLYQEFPLTGTVFFSSIMRIIGGRSGRDGGLTSSTHSRHRQRHHGIRRFRFHPSRHRHTDPRLAQGIRVHDCCQRHLFYDPGSVHVDPHAADKGDILPHLGHPDGTGPRLDADLCTSFTPIQFSYTSETSSQLIPLPPPLPQQFECCGYFNSTSPAFVSDATCPSPAAAALLTGCAASIASFANVFVDDIFTAVFGMASIDGVLVLATACLLKDRKERERFRYIDSKSLSSSF